MTRIPRKWQAPEIKLFHVAFERHYGTSMAYAVAKALADDSIVRLRVTTPMWEDMARDVGTRNAAQCRSRLHTEWDTARKNRAKVGVLPDDGTSITKAQAELALHVPTEIEAAERRIDAAERRAHDAELRRADAAACFASAVADSAAAVVKAAAAEQDLNRMAWRLEQLRDRIVAGDGWTVFPNDVVEDIGVILAPVTIRRLTDEVARLKAAADGAGR